MKMFKEKITKYSFWTGLSAAMVVLCTTVGKAFGFSIDNQIVEDIIMSVCGVLVALGIVCRPKTNTGKTKLEQSDNSNKIQDSEYTENNE